MTIPEYEKEKEFKKLFGLQAAPPPGRATVFCGRVIASFGHEYLDQNPGKRRDFEELEKIIQHNPLSVFVPQCDEALLFLNDQEHTLKGFIGGNGVGKSVICAIDMLLDICECDPSWPIFTEHGIKYRPYRGVRDVGGVGMVSYEWRNHQETIWPQIIKKWVPPGQLEGNPNWRSNPHVHIAGTPCSFMACSQDNSVFESSAKDLIWWDEQGQEEKFNGANSRVRRRNGRHILGLTPHKIEGRPDTGAGNWIHGMFEGEFTAGLKIKFWQVPIFSVVDWVFSEENKKAAFKEWIEEPSDLGNSRKVREGESRIYGHFHQTSGLVFDELEDHLHFIDDVEIPKGSTIWRGIDHGRIEPCAALLWAVTPDGDNIIFREYYQKDLIVSQNAKSIIEMSGNRQRRIGEVGSGMGDFVPRYEEDIVEWPIFRTFLDSRSLSKKTDESRFSIGDLYKINGLYISPADGKDSYQQIPVCKEYFAIDPEKKHIQTGELGAPSVYICRSCANFIWELKRYMNEEVSRKARQTGKVTQAERPRAKDDHLIAAFRFLCMARPYFVPGFSDMYHVDNEEESDIVNEYDPYTGY